MKNLEEAVRFPKDDSDDTPAQYRYFIKREQDLDRDYKSGAQISHQSSNNMPKNVLGMYYPGQHSTTLTHWDYIDTRNYSFVKAHESAHARGVYDEVKADAIAAAETGYILRPELILGPIKRVA